MVKWLTRITVTAQESTSYYHYYDNRLLPSMVDPERADREDWWHRPDYIINDLNLNSAITHPVSTSSSSSSGGGDDGGRIRSLLETCAFSSSFLLTVCLVVCYYYCYRLTMKRWW